MPTDSESDLQLEIGHVLLIDIVGYSKLLITEQRERLQGLNEIVRNTAQFRASDANGMLVRIPTGDGMALIFRDSVEAPVRCALEISQAVKTHPEIHLRMGIHSGPVSEVTDVNERTNIAGAGIDIAQRVMDCGDAGHILLSKHVADDLAPYPRWNRYLHDLGECEVKHGGVLSVVNFYTDEIGNPQPPEKFKRGRHRRVKGIVTPGASPTVRPMWIAVWLAAACILIAALWIFSHRVSVRSVNAPVPPIAAKPVSDKSIAVLPFENLSEEKANAYFADGLTEEILNRLAQISALKVPGRTSSFAFKNQNRDLRQIGAALSVAQVLEGGVRKSGDRLRITAQLVRTSDGYQLWSQAYDRKLDDVFAIQEEIARSIADALSVQLKLVRENKSERPTQDMEAYDNYLEARALITQRTGDNLRRAAALLEAAVQRDPGFAKAWAALAQARALAPYYRLAAMKDSLEDAETAARKALAIDDSLAAAHSALADVLRDRFDWLAAEAEYRRALDLNPGEAETHNQYAQMLLKVGHLDAAMEHANRARELDPLAWVPPSIAGLIHLCRGEFAQSRELLDRSEKLRGKLEGLLIRFELLYALSKGDGVLARRALAMAPSSSAGEWTLPSNKKLVETMDQALVYASNPSGPPPNFGRAREEAEVLGEPNIGLALAAVEVFVKQQEAALDTLWSDYRSAAAVDLSLIWTPIFQPLRKEPRFLELLKAANLPAYWRQAGWGDFCRPKGTDDFECVGP
jgi:adenylate cyclase